MYGRRRLTRLEAGLYAAIAGIVITFFAWQALDYMEIAERAAVNATLHNVAAGLNARLAQDLMRRGRIEPDWVGRNPFELARVRAPNYVGAVETVEAVPSASWAFDLSRGELVYVPRLASRLRTADLGRALRFRLVRSANGVSYEVRPATPYRWE